MIKRYAGPIRHSDAFELLGPTRTSLLSLTPLCAVHENSRSASRVLCSSKMWRAPLCSNAFSSFEKSFLGLGCCLCFEKRRRAPCWIPNGKRRRPFDTLWAGCLWDALSVHCSVGTVFPWEREKQCNPTTTCPDSPRQQLSTQRGRAINLWWAFFRFQARVCLWCKKVPSIVTRHAMREWLTCAGEVRRPPLCLSGLEAGLGLKKSSTLTQSADCSTCVKITVKFWRASSGFQDQQSLVSQCQR